MKIFCPVLCFNYSLYDVRRKKTLNSEITSLCMHFCVMKSIDNTLRGLFLWHFMFGEKEEAE